MKRNLRYSFGLGQEPERVNAGPITCTFAFLTTSVGERPAAHDPLPLDALCGLVCTRVKHCCYDCMCYNTAHYFPASHSPGLIRFRFTSSWVRYIVRFVAVPVHSSSGSQRHRPHHPDLPPTIRMPLSNLLDRAPDLITILFIHQLIDSPTNYLPTCLPTYLPT